MSDIFKIEKGVVTGLNNKDYEGDIIVPEYDNHIRVTQIAAEAFANCERIISVQIPDSITSIGKFAFFNCKRLKAVTLGHGINKIERSAFQNCEALESIELHYGIPEIASWTFAGCKSLKEVVIPNGVKYIGHQAFADCVSLEHIDTLSSETTLGYDVFQNMNSKCVITVPLYFDERYKKLQQWNEFEIKVNEKRIFSYNGLRYHEVETRKTIAVAERENTFFSGHANIPSTITIKYKDEDLSLEVCRIDASAFYGNNLLTSVYIPKSVASIGAGAFARCTKLEYFASDNMTSEEECFTAIDGVLFTKAMDELVAYPAGNDRQTYLIPASVKVIRNYAFSSIDSLLRITFPNKKYMMQVSVVFDQAKLANCCAFIPKDATALKESLESVGFKMINEENFVSDGLNYKILTDDETGHTVEVCGNASFVGELKIPEKVEFAGVDYQVVSIGEQAFFGDNRITSLSMPKTMIEIKRRAFESASLSRITIPSRVEKIGLQAFNSMKNVGNEIEVPASVNEIGDNAFSQSSFRLKVNNGNKYYCSEDNVLFDKAKTKLIYYMASKPLCDKYIVPSTVTVIDSRAFAEAKIKHLCLPVSVAVINAAVFYGNYTIEKISIDAKQPPILKEYSWFTGTNPNMIVLVPKGCAAKYKAADGWKQIANQIIDEIPSVFTKEKINYKVVSMDNKTVEVAQNQNASGAISIPNVVQHCGDSYTVEGIGDRAFDRNTKITSISLPSTIKYVGYGAFYQLTISMKLPSSLERIGSYAFAFNKFADLTLPSKLKEIGNCAFQSTTVENQRVTIPSSVTTIDGNPFICARVKEIVVNNNAYFVAKDNVLFSKDGLKIISYPLLKADQTYTIPNGVTTIANNFIDNENLNRLVIPSTVKKLGDGALWSFTNLKTLEVQCTTPPAVGKDPIHEMPANCLVLVPKGCVSKYKAAEGWKVYADRIVDEIIPEIRYISLKNNGGFVVSIRVKGGSESYNDSSFPVGQERTVDLANAVGKIKEGDTVYLEAVVKSGNNRTAGERFTYRKASNLKARYSIKGTILSPKLSFNGISS